MLTDLDIKHFVTIRTAHISFQPGLTVVTGDTGAGKSLLMGAIAFALGGKPPLKQSALPQVSLTFDLSDLPNVQTWLSQEGLDQEEPLCIIQRSLNEQQRSRCLINQTPTTLKTVKHLATLLLDIHGQHDSQLLLQPDHQRQLVDQFCQDRTLAKKVNQAYQQWQQANLALIQAQQDQQHQQEQRQLLRYQLDELNEITLEPETASELETEHKKLANAEQLYRTCQTTIRALEGGDASAPALIPSIDKIMQTLLSQAEAFPSFNHLIEHFNQARIYCEEALHLVRDLTNQVEPNPQSLHDINGLISTLQDLARKHHVKLADLYQKKTSLQHTLDQLESADQTIEKLQSQCEATLATYYQWADQLSTQRQKASLELSHAVQEGMKSLNFLQAKVRIDLSKSDDNKPNPHGHEQVVFQISTNPGQAMQPMHLIASGGEISRISLAIQVATTSETTKPTLLFDEVDTGIGGKTAEMVGKQLRALGQNHQVICITHLAQVACQGNHHLVVAKHATDNQTHSEVHTLTHDQKIAEIARMVGGINISEETLAHARAMLVDG